MRQLEETARLHDQDFFVGSDKNFRMYIDVCKLDRIPFHDHDHTEITVMLDGETTMFTQDKSYELKRGDVVVCTPGMAHGFKNNLGVKHSVIGFEKERYIDPSIDLRSLSGYEALFVIEPSLRDKKDVLHNLRIPDHNMTKLESLLQRMLVEFTQKEPGYSVSLKSLTNELVVFLCREFAKQNDERYQASDIHLIAQVVDFIHKRFAQKITLSDLAKIYGCSNEHLIRQFKSVYEMTPMDYLTHIRVQRSCEDLLSTKDSVTEVAFRNGFNDSNYFSRCFKKKIGISPLAYRRHRLR